MKQSGNTGEVVLLAARQTPETLIKQSGAGFDAEAVMNAIVANVLAREAVKVQTNPHPFTLVALFCGVGLVAALILVSAGFDLGTEFF
jgi:hypothetical protein